MKCPSLRWWMMCVGLTVGMIADSGIAEPKSKVQQLVIDGTVAKAISVAVSDLEATAIDSSLFQEKGWQQGAWRVEVREDSKSFIVYVAPASGKVRGGDVEYTIRKSDFHVLRRVRGK